MPAPLTTTLLVGAAIELGYNALVVSSVLLALALVFEIVIFLSLGRDDGVGS